MAKKEKQFKVKCVKDVNDAWCGYALVRRPDGFIYRINCAATPNGKAISSKKEVAAMLEEAVAEYIADNPGSVRINIEEDE